MVTFDTVFINHFVHLPSDVLLTTDETVAFIWCQSVVARTDNPADASCFAIQSNSKPQTKVRAWMSRALLVAVKFLFIVVRACPHRTAFLIRLTPFDRTSGCPLSTLVFSSSP